MHRSNVFSIFLSQIFGNSYHSPNIVLVGSIIMSNFPPSGMVVILSAMISLQAGRAIDLTHQSFRGEVTDQPPIVKRPDEVINFVTLDLAPLTHGSAPVGVWHGDAGLNQ